MVDASIRGSIYLLNMLSAFFIPFLKTIKIFFAKIPFSVTHHQITYFLWSLEENEYAVIKYPINLKHDEDVDILK